MDPLGLESGRGRRLPIFSRQMTRASRGEGTRLKSQAYGALGYLTIAPHITRYSSCSLRRKLMLYRIAETTSRVISTRRQAKQRHCTARCFFHSSGKALRHQRILESCCDMKYSGLTNDIVIAATL